MSTGLFSAEIAMIGIWIFPIYIIWEGFTTGTTNLEKKHNIFKTNIASGGLCQKWK